MDMHFLLFGVTAPGCRTGCYNPLCTSQTWGRKHACADTHSHTCTLADNYPNSLWREERPCGPHNRFRQEPWTPKTLLLCPSLKPCVCFTWLCELDLSIFTAFCSLCIPMALKYAKSSHGTNLKMFFAKATCLELQFRNPPMFSAPGIWNVFLLILLKIYI